MISILPEAPVSSAVNVKLLVVLEKLTLTPTSESELMAVSTLSSAVSAAKENSLPLIVIVSLSPVSLSSSPNVLLVFR